MAPATKNKSAFNTHRTPAFLKIAAVLLLCLTSLACDREAEDLYYPMTDRVSLAYDPTDSLTIAEAVADQEFFPQSGGRLNLAFVKGSAWLKLDLKNISTKDIAIVQNSRTDFVQVYTGGGQGYTARTAGFSVERSLWPNKETFPTYYFTPEETKAPVYMQVRTKGSMQVRLLVFDKDRLGEYTHRYSIGYGVFYGIMLVMLLYNFFIMLSVKDRTYFFYIAYIAAFIFFISDLNGLSYRYLWSESPVWQRQATVFFSSLVMFFAVLFAVNFLDTKKYNPPWMHKSMVALAVLSVPAMLSPFLSFTWISGLLHSLHIVAMLANILVLASAVMAWSRGQRSARYFLLAWSTFLFGSFVSMLFYLGVLPKLFITTYSFQIAGCIEVTLLSFALADRFNTLRLEKEHIEQAKAKAEDKLSTIDEDLKLARSIQESLLPKHIPVVNGATISVQFNPSFEVSGDYYDFHHLSANEVGILIADVSGHGIPAAMLASMVKVAFAHARESARCPQAMLENMSSFLLPHLGNHFLTGIYIYINTETRQLVLARAGHPPALYLNHNSGDVDAIYPRGTFVGQPLDPKFEVYERNIGIGDQIVLFTDGVLDVTNEDQEIFGLERLRNLIMTEKDSFPQEKSQAMVNRLSDWAGRSEGFPDDIAMVTVVFHKMVNLDKAVAAHRN